MVKEEFVTCAQSPVGVQSLVQQIWVSTTAEVPLFKTY